SRNSEAGAENGIGSRCCGGRRRTRCSEYRQLVLFLKVNAAQVGFGSQQPENLVSRILAIALVCVCRNVEAHGHGCADRAEAEQIRWDVLLLFPQYLVMRALLFA